MYWVDGFCPTTHRGETCIDSHEWVLSIVGHYKFNDAQERRRLPKHTMGILNNKEHKAKLPRDNQGTSKPTVIGSHTVHSAMKPFEEEAEANVPSEEMDWAEEMNKEDENMDIADEETRA